MRIVNKSDVKEHLQELLAVQITEDMPIYEVYDDSIKMFQVLSKINNGFHINLGMIDLVMCDTVDKLIEKITLESKNVVNIVGEEQLSLIQQSYWIGREQEFYGASNSTHLYLEVHHNLDLMKLEKVIRTLIKRHMKYVLLMK
ncbi:acyl carrier protein [Dorea formicigenerans]|uniref:acyl carrier protein n=1 Tax=Dorea formicigenerans TaxID=39486 RepID=UPI0035691B29